eukprot:augustus_masked-scaffold_9-processed-gene-10.54-mRNA-1 protein AED:0.72 eAED:0.74 QI:0/-1/0/1/-1/1/1/0/325
MKKRSVRNRRRVSSSVDYLDDLERNDYIFMQNTAKLPPNFARIPSKVKNSFNVDDDTFSFPSETRKKTTCGFNLGLKSGLFILVSTICYLAGDLAQKEIAKGDRPVQSTVFGYSFYSLDAVPTFPIPARAPVSWGSTKSPTKSPTKPSGWGSADTNSPSAYPTDVPTSRPTESPILEDIPETAFPSESPSSTPSDSPTFSPENENTDSPITASSDAPSVLPTKLPSNVPSSVPTNLPSNIPSSVPTSLPTGNPTAVETNSPSTSPSLEETVQPTTLPTLLPTAGDGTSTGNASFVAEDNYLWTAGFSGVSASSLIGAALNFRYVG